MNKLTKLSLLLCAFFLLSLSTVAQEKKEPEWTPEAIINTEYVGSPVFSPDGKMVVWSKREGSKEKDSFITNLYLTRLDLKKDGKFRTFQLTAGEDSEYNPLFAQDAETIYFLSSRDKGKKLWSLSIYGGEAQEVHEFSNGISSLQWIDENHIAFEGSDGKTLYEQELEKSKDNTVIVEDSVHWTPSRVYSFDLKEKEIKRLTDNDYPISSYKVSPDGRWLVASLQMSRHFASDATPDPTHFLWDLQNNTRKQILQELETPGSFTFTADSKGFYLSATKNSDPRWNGAGIEELYHYDIASGKTTKVDLKADWGLSGTFYTIGADVLVPLANGATDRMAFYKKSGNSWSKQELPLGSKKDHVRMLEVNPKGSKALYVHSTASQLPEYYVADISVHSRKGISLLNESTFVELNAGLKKKPIAKSEVFSWTGANGDKVEGILYYPHDFEAGKKYPLVLSIHGGPSGVDQDSWSERWSTYPNIMAEKGAFVLKPNYHGSSNYGLAFVESIKGHYYDLEMVDITEGIKALDAKGYIDMDKLGVMGWSNGAILATMLTVRYPDMFKVATPGAGDVNWTSDFGTCRFGVQFDQSYFGGAPWDDRDGKFYNETYIIKSPLFEIEKIKTPTMIFHGSEDRAVPRDQGWEYYRGLQQVGKAPVRFLWFPGQPHGLGKITHQLRKMKEEIAWFERFLFKTWEPENEAFKEESPLGQMLEIQKSASRNGLFGTWTKDALIPEVVAVKKDSISIGRFEVTNAQYEFYDLDHDYEAGKGNAPVTGLSKEQISGYLKWLNEKTGSTYRLPNAKEGEKLAEKAQSAATSENVLNQWAGYELSVYDLAAFKSKIEELKLSLLKEVGQNKAVKLGEAKVYDLGGNAAEYYLDGDSLKTYGYSAYDYVDSSDKRNTPASAHTGFRVVMEPKK